MLDPQFISKAVDLAVTMRCYRHHSMRAHPTGDVERLYHRHRADFYQHRVWRLVNDLADLA